jgi:hypothetical protein
MRIELDIDDDDIKQLLIAKTQNAAIEYCTESAIHDMAINTIKCIIFETIANYSLQSEILKRKKELGDWVLKKTNNAGQEG